METENNKPTNIEQLDDIAKSFMRETDALRELVRTRDLQIQALKAHSLCLRANMKDILETLLDKVIDSDIQFHAKRMIEGLDQAGDAVDKVGLK